MDIEPSTKEELAKLGTQALKDLYENLAGAKQFVLAQAPDICQQMIAWQVATAVLLVILTGLIVGAFFFAWWKTRECGPYDVAPPLVLIFGGISIFVSFVMMCIQVTGAVQAIVAPKLFLLERIAAMLR